MVVKVNYLFYSFPLRCSPVVSPVISFKVSVQIFGIFNKNVDFSTALPPVLKVEMTHLLS